MTSSDASIQAGSRRRRAGLAAGFAVVAAIAAGVFALTTGSTANSKAFVRGTLSPAAATACAGPPTPVVSAPSGLNNARAVGRVLWVNAPIYGNGYPTGSVVGANGATDLSRVVLRGWRCSDGRLLRFWFYFHKGDEGADATQESPFANHHGPVTSSALASTGTFTLIVRIRSLLDGSLCGGAYTHPASCFMQGYLMFSSPGKWVIQAQAGKKILGTAVFDLHG